MAFLIASVKLPTGGVLFFWNWDDHPLSSDHCFPPLSLPREGVYCGVTLEPYVLIKRGDTVISADEIPSEGAADGLYQLRSRWYRSSIPRGGAICGIHPDREATLQCIVCLRSKVAQHLSYHCSG